MCKLGVTGTDAMQYCSVNSHLAPLRIVSQAAKMTPETLEAGYWKAYRDFYRWNNIFQGAWVKDSWGDRLRHLAYSGAWKKLEPIWDFIIRAKHVDSMLPALEIVLNSFDNSDTRKGNLPATLQRNKILYFIFRSIHFLLLPNIPNQENCCLPILELLRIAKP